MKLYLQLLIVCAAISAAVVEAAEPEVYHCRGVDYLYDSGVGAGETRQVDGWRNLIFRRWTTTAEIYSESGSVVTELVLSSATIAPAFEGFIPAYNDVFGTPIRGIVVEYIPLYHLLELKYELDDGRRFPAFSGICG